MTKERILQFIEYKGITRSIFFNDTGIKRGFLDADKLEGAVSDIQIAMIVAAYPDLNVEWLILGKGEMCVRRDDTFLANKTSEDLLAHSHHDQEVPLYDISAAAGCVMLFQDSNNMIPIDTIKIPNLPKCDGAIFARGDSMYPIIKSGDIILYKVMQGFETIIWGEAYIVTYESDGDYYTVVKYVKRSTENKGNLVLLSQNEHHQSFEIHLSQVKSMALVRASVRYNNM